MILHLFQFISKLKVYQQELIFVNNGIVIIISRRDLQTDLNFATLLCLKVIADFIPIVFMDRQRLQRSSISILTLKMDLYTIKSP